MERDNDYGKDHGAARIAILFLGADGIASYDALFCQSFSISAPFAVLLQDHGFGGNYNNFGADGLMAKIAQKSNIFPSLLHVAEGTIAWKGYEKLSGVEGDFGGMHCNHRFLYKRLD